MKVLKAIVCVLSIGIALTILTALVSCQKGAKYGDDKIVLEEIPTTDAYKWE